MTDALEAVFVAVNYNTTAQALSLARRFDALAPMQAMLIFVDNSTGEHVGELVRALAEARSGVACIMPDTNLGYLGGARFGLEVLRSRGVLFRWLVVSNVDLQFDPRAVVACLAGLTVGHIGVVAPNITSVLTGKSLNPYMRRRPRRLRMHAYKWIYRFYFSMKVYEWLSLMRGRLHAVAVRQGRRRKQMAAAGAGDDAVLVPIYAGHGSMLVFSEEYFRRGCSLDHAPFLFGEEISVAEAARRADLSVVWHPEIIVEHAEHASIGNLPGRRMHGYLKEATAYCADTHF